ncbi:glycosyltransferase family 4 protein [Exiguobacterium sp. SL14]|nr:glycosyltransferase family 4 protein [Exiguobacterium sp. SL14]MCY1689905.1 glycosyltransferase family 4 protein [Exiguobacterium sp. SL14]
MKILFITNIPSPYRIEFFNQLGEFVDLTVVFEAKKAEAIRFDWNVKDIRNFNAIFLSENKIKERKINFKIFSVINNEKYDFIISTSYAYMTELFAILYLQFKKIPYFLEIDGGFVKNESRLLFNLKKRLISKAEGYFSPSKDSDNYLTNYYADSQQIFRYPFTSLSRKDLLNNSKNHENSCEFRKNLGVDNDSKVILFVGRFVDLKGIDVLLNSIVNIKTEKVTVIIVGGEAKDEYINIIKNIKNTKVIFKSFQSKLEIEKYYRIADLFVFPTRQDVWGLVVNEALSFGVPVITTNNCGSGKEIIKNGINGYLIENENVNELTQRIDSFFSLSSGDRQKMKVNSLLSIKKYSIENMVEEHLNIFLKKGEKNNV